ncbi:hypothetical protein AAVH_30974 [Aphelenchoides avenae]|nr:hypothetical protein AAVH_30974 [Aphelenchus avenae]
MNAARFSCRVGTLDLIKFHVDDAFTVPEVVDLLRVPTAAALDKIVVSTCTPTSSDYSMLEDFLFSPTTPAFELRLCSQDDMPLPPTSILTLPRFLDAKDTSNVIGDFCLILGNFDGAAFVDLPPTNRVKQFRQELIHAFNSYDFRQYRYGEEVTTRVHTYRNAHTGEVLSAVRQADRTYHNNIHFLKGHISLDNLRHKWTN